MCDRTIGRFEARRGFTLVELLVVIGVIALLAALLATSTAGAKEKSKRTACRNNARQLIVSILLYASDHNENLLLGGGEIQPTFRSDYHTSLLDRNVFTNLMAYLTVVEAADCPNLHRRFVMRKVGVVYPAWRDQSGYGVVLGYHYLGGHANNSWDAPTGLNDPAGQSWKSPQKTTDDPSLPLVADMNTWYVHTTVVPHGSRGAIIYEEDYFNHPNMPDQITAKKAGATGGNIGQLNGAVEWKTVSKMRTRSCGPAILGMW